MSWGDWGHVVIVLYLIALYVWVQHLMIRMTRMQRELDQYRWSLKQANAPMLVPKCTGHQWRSTHNGMIKCNVCGDVRENWLQ